MRKIVIIVCILLTGASIVFARIKASEAVKNFEMAKTAREQADENRLIAVEAQRAAEDMAIKAREQIVRLQTELEECKTK